MKNRGIFFTIATVLIASLGLSTFINVAPASALAGSDWQAGRIIDDTVFTNKSAMSVTEIQTFLNTMIGTGGYDSVPGQCDTYGVRNASPYNSGITRAAYAASIGRPTRWTCLNNYYEVPKTTPGPGVPANNFGSDTIPSGAKSAAQLIWDAAQQYNISPKVLLTTIQKESAGPLTTDDWPWQSQYTYAMGAHCPDTAPCDPNYAGFSIQIAESAALFRYYLDNMNQPWWPYKKPGINSILYNPSSNCGSSNVNILTYATAALYTYTPYQPNQAALNNLYGSGDGCSAYGNRNFWRIYSNWFGPTTSALGGISMTNIVQPYTTPARGETVTYTYSLTNNLATAVTLSAVGVVGRLGSLDGINRDFGWQGPVTLQPGVPQQFTFTSQIRDVGTLYVWPAVNYQGAYTHYNNWGTTLVSHSPNLTLSQPLVTNATEIYAGQNVTFTATVKNNEPHPINYDAIGIPVKFYDTYNYDAAWVGPGVLNAGAEISLSGTRTIDKPGPFTYWVSNYSVGTYTTIGAVKKFNAQIPTPNFSVSSLSFTNNTPVKGESLGASFTVTNNLPVPIDVDGVGIVGRLGTFSGANRDIGWQGPVHFNAGETKSFTAYSRTITDVGTHYYWIGILRQGAYTQYNNWGSTIVSLAPNFSVSGMTFSNTTPTKGQVLTATSFTITNNLPVAIDVDAVGVVGRFGTFSGPNRDLGWQGPVHFNAGEVKSFNNVFSRTITDVGTHYYWIGILSQGNYMQYNNWGSTIVSLAP